MTALEQQISDEETRLDNLAAILRQTMAPAADWSYRPSASDDWRDWCEVGRFAAADLRYRYACGTVGILRAKGHALYCMACGEEPQAPDWRPSLCLACWWEADGYGQALTMARRLGRRWVEQTRQGRAA